MWLKNVLQRTRLERRDCEHGVPQAGSRSSGFPLGGTKGRVVSAFLAQITLLVLILCLPSPLLAEEWKSEAWNCAIEIPNTFVQRSEPMPNGAEGVAWNNGLGDNFIILVINATPPGTKFDQKFIGGLERGISEHKNVRKFSGELVTLQNLPAYRIVKEMEANGHILSSISLVTLQSNRLYNLTVQSLDRSSVDDPALLSALNSFRFLVPPTPSLATTAERADSSPRIGSDNISYLIGRGTVYVLLGIVVLWFVVKGLRG